MQTNDGGGIGECKVVLHCPSKRGIRQQLCYVAVSRARTGVWLLGGETSSDLRASWQREFDNAREPK